MNDYALRLTAAKPVVILEDPESPLMGELLERLIRGMDTIGIQPLLPSQHEAAPDTPVLLAHFSIFMVISKSDGKPLGWSIAAYLQLVQEGTVVGADLPPRGVITWQTSTHHYVSAGEDNTGWCSGVIDGLLARLATARNCVPTKTSDRIIH